MSKNRVSYVLIALALLAATAVSLRQVVVSKAAGSASVHQADRSYDGIENLRSSQSSYGAVPQADHSYDGIESLRQNRLAPSMAKQGGQCPDGECSYQLSNGQWVR